MSSRNKDVVLQRHNENHLLKTPSTAGTVGGFANIASDEPPASLDERIIASTLDALEAGQTHYVDVPGIAPLREAVASYLNVTTESQYITGNILVTAGMQEARFLTIQMIGATYGNMTLPSVVHPGVRKALGVRALPEVNFIGVSSETALPSLENIQFALESGCRLIYLESPSRLTGAAYSAAEVAQIAELLRSYETAAIWDGGLSAWADEDAVACLASHTDSSLQIALIGEAFPGSGLASWLVGYIAAPESWISAMQSQKQIMAICTSTPSQYGALEASRLYSETHPARRNQLASLRTALVEKLHAANRKTLSGEVASTLAVCLDTQDKEQVSAILRAAGYKYADGADFGMPDVLRFTVSSSAAEAIQLLI